MVLLNWRREYEIGIPAVDHEHRALIDLINELHANLKKGESAAKISDFLGDVFAAISAHFALEERVMREHAYDGFDAHKAEHEQLLDDIRDVMDRHENGDYADSDQELAEHLRSWFLGHFSTLDARLHKALGDHF